MAGKRRGGVAEQRPGAELTTTYNNAVALDGSRKRYCRGCGGLRDVQYAETHDCVACGSRGTVKRIPQFDEFGELIEQVEAPVVVVAEPKEVKAKPPTQKQQVATAKVATAALFRRALRGAS